MKSLLELKMREAESAEVDSGDAAASSGQFRAAFQHYITAFQSLSARASPDVAEPLVQKIIKVELQLNPPPAVPEDALRHAAYAQAAVEEAAKDAKSSRLDDAVHELEKAIRLAPWWGDTYFNLAAVLERTDHPGEAARALQLYLLAEPHAANAQEVQMEIYKLQYKDKQQ